MIAHSMLVDSKLFGGNDELADAWQSFAEGHASRNGPIAAQRQRALLESLLNTDLSMKDFAERQKLTPIRQMADDIHEICEAQSLSSMGGGIQRELNDFIAGRLLQRWFEIAAPVGLYPPKTANRNTSKDAAGDSPKPEETPSAEQRTVDDGKPKMGYREQLQDDRLALRSTIAGSVLSWALHGATAGSQRGAEKKIGERINHQYLAADSVSSYGLDVFVNSLFAFDDTKGNVEGSSLGRRFNNYVFGRTLTIVPQNIGKNAPKDDSIHRTRKRKKGDDSELVDDLHDERSIDPARAAEQKDTSMLVSAVLEDMEKAGSKFARQAAVLRLRMGIGEGAEPMTLEQAGRALGITRERVRQIEANAYPTFKRFYEKRERALQRKREEASLLPEVEPVVPPVGQTPNRPDALKPSRRVEPVVIPDSSTLDEELMAKKIEAELEERRRRKQTQGQTAAVISTDLAGGESSTAPVQMTQGEQVLPMTDVGGEKKPEVTGAPTRPSLEQTMGENAAISGLSVESEQQKSPRNAAEAKQLLRRFFSEESPELDFSAKGAQRALEVAKFLRALRIARGAPDVTQLSRDIATSDASISADSLAMALKRMRVPDDEIDQPLSEKAKGREYRAILVNEGESGNQALAVARYAFPDEADAALRKNCLRFLSERELFWSRKIGEPSKKTNVPVVKRLGFEQTTFNDTDPITIESAREIVQRIADQYDAMPGFERAKAEAIATDAFKALTEPYSISRVSTLSAGKVNGKETQVTSGTLSRWKSGRKEAGVVNPAPVSIDTVSQVADALAYSIFPGTPEGKALAERMTNYLSGVPWSGNKNNSELLAYALEKNLDAAGFFLLSRRQLRMPQHEFESYLGIAHERYSEMIAPEGKSYAKRVNLGDFEGFVERLKFANDEERAAFRKLVLRKPRGDFGREEQDLQRVAMSILQPGSDTTMADFVKGVMELHGFRSAEDLVEGVLNNERRRGVNPSPTLKPALERELRKALMDKEPEFSPSTARVFMAFALPGVKNRDLSESLVERCGEHAQGAADAKAGGGFVGSGRK